MLKTIELRQFDKNMPCVVLLGGFDGLHIGHRSLLEKAKTFGLPIGVMTIAGGKSTKNLFTTREKEDIFRRAGADFFFSLPFLEIQSLSPECFLSYLKKSLNPSVFVCGEDFRFGAGAAGNATSVEKYSKVPTHIGALLEIDGRKISSTTVKNCLENGDTLGANRLLGEPFFLIGEVIHDRAIGRTIGFPTANIVYPDEKFSLKKGVYATRIEVDGRCFDGITNYGARPTFDNGRVLTETHLIGFSGDLYGRELKIEFLRYLRENRKFDSVEELKIQLTKDVRRVIDND